MSEAKATDTPRHLWIVGISALLWSLLGTMDFILLETGNEWYTSHFTPEQVEFGRAYPGWLVALWAIAVGCGVVGSVLLLLRKKLAAPALLVSFVCMVVVIIRNFAFAGKTPDIDVGVVIFIVVVLALVGYTRSMARKGVLV